MDTPLPDPADWLSTPLAALANVDSLLRCQICKDYYTSAVLTNCAHSFCSVCIRRCLSVESRCPTCNTPEQESRLRRNVTLQEVVDAFVTRRGELLSAARIQSNETRNTPPGKKRKRQELGTVEDEPPSRRTRSQRNSSHKQDQAANGRATEFNTVILDSDNDELGNDEYKPGPEPDDGLVACPSCSKRMKEEYVFTHLDNCMGESKPSPAPVRKPSAPTSGLSPAPAPVPQRLPQLSYNLLKDNALRKKLDDLKIPSWGARALQIRRHSEWLALWNANCDSNRPKSKPELLRELDAWERSQGGRSNNTTNGDGIKGKEFEPEEYNRRHGTEFTDLIAQARANAAAKKQISKSVEAVNGDGGTKTASPAENAIEDPAYEKESLYRRGNTAPPSTGPLKASESLASDTIISPDPQLSTISNETNEGTATVPPLTHSSTMPEARSPARQQAAQPTIHPRISRPITTTYSPSRSPTSAKFSEASPGHRRPSISQASPIEPPSPAMLMWSGSHEAQGEARRRLPMFHVPREPIVDSDFDAGSK